jgi:uncharacterized membrane protein YebE (DUF533 family)
MFWKLVGGAVAGASLIAATPVAAPLAIGLGALTGAMIGAVSGDLDELKEMEGGKYWELLQEFEKATDQIANKDQYFDLLLAMVAIGSACGAADGQFDELEKTEIEEFLKQINDQDIPETVKAKMTQLVDSPPSIDEAFDLVDKIDLKTNELFKVIFELIIFADGVEHSGEIEFRKRWRSLNQ